MFRQATVVMLCAVLLSGCEHMSKKESGTLIGATAGGLIGSQIGGGSGRLLAIFAGTLIGAMAGSEIGADMDANDRHRAQHALEHNPSDEPSTWVNPDTGREYRVTPKRTYVTAQGPCREFETSVKIDDREETLVGEACRQNDGTWKTVN